MSRSNIRIEQIEEVAEYCRVDASGATPPVGAWTSLDAEAFSITEDNFAMPANTTTRFYIGSTTAWSILGFRVGLTPPEHTGWTFEYYNGGWVALTILADTTAAFNHDGYATFVAPGDWALTTINGASAFWIRFQSTGVTVTGTGHHFMPTINSKPPVKLVLNNIDPVLQYTRDVNGNLKRKDTVLKIIKNLTIECTQNCFTMDQINYLMKTMEFRQRVRVTDLAITDPPNPFIDAYWKYFEGYLTGDLSNLLSPKKMLPEDYSIFMEVDKAFSIFAVLGPQPE